MANDNRQLIVTFEGNPIRTVALTMPVLTIGRGPENGLALPHPAVSSPHAELRVEPTGSVLIDAGSKVGTRVDGVALKAHQPKLLTDGAVCEIGPFVLTYRDLSAQAQTNPIDPAKGKPASIASDPLVVISPLVGRHAPTPVMRARVPGPAPVATGPASQYLRDLPVIFHAQDFLGRFLQIFESLWEPLEQREDHIDMYFSPRTCPVSFLPWLASWLHIALNPHWPEVRCRALLADAMDLYRWRGTAYGLTRMLEVCTGITPVLREDPAQPCVFHISMTLPAGSGLRRELIEELIVSHKPAHAGYVLEV